MLDNKDLIPIANCTIRVQDDIECTDAPTMSWLSHTGWHKVKPPYHIVKIGSAYEAQLVRETKAHCEIVDRFMRYKRAKNRAIKAFLKSI